MDQNTDNAQLIKGLRARLELDAELGIEYVSLSDSINSLISNAETSAPPRRAPEQDAFRPARERFHEKTPPPAPSSSREQQERAPAPSSPPSPSPSPPAPPPLREGHVSLVPFTAARVNPEKEAALAGLRSECMACTACELCERRNTVVWGEGSLDAKVMFIGEGPGRDEDAEGRPFVGRSGRLLTDIIEKGMKLPRNGVYIANVVKCRPPGNRDPKPEEVAACSRYLTRQIEVIGPKAIVAVGNVAGRALLGLDAKASGLRGRWREYRGIPMRVIFHPSYLLRQRRGEHDRTEADRATWMDVQEVTAKLGE